MSETEDLQLLCARQTEQIRVLQAQVAQLTDDERKTDPSNLRPSSAPTQQAPWDMSDSEKLIELVVGYRRMDSQLAEVERRLGDGSDHMANIDRNVAKVSAEIAMTNQTIHRQSGELVEIRRVCHGNHPPDLSAVKEG
jgi:hypothetical protein